MSDKYNRLQDIPEEQELLTIMMEECSEVIQQCSKIIRFGNNMEQQMKLSGEIGDLLAMIDLLEKYYMIDIRYAEECMERKYGKLEYFSNLKV